MQDRQKILKGQVHIEEGFVSSLYLETAIEVWRPEAILTVLSLQ